ncbi:hypothetical protein ACLM5H_18170 [Fredinandcohnia humi]
MEEQKNYREELLEWCNNIFFHWERMKPTFTNIIEIESLNEWEETCLELKEKLQTDVRVEFNDFQTAKNLFEQWEKLYSKTLYEQEDIEENFNRSLKMEEQMQSLQDLVDWSRNIYIHLERIKPGFSNLIDINNKEEWNEFCTNLKEKTNVNFEDYKTARSLYEQYELLYREADAFKEVIESVSVE